MKVTLPDIPDAERTPTVNALLDLIQQLRDRIALLEDQIATLKGLNPRPVIKPSTLEAPTPTGTPLPKPGKRPGSDKRAKTAQLTIHHDVVVPLPNPPAQAIFKGYEDYVVQDLVLEAKNTRYRRERWQTADGKNLVAPLPATVIPGSHFGPTLHTLVLHQYHHQRVTQPLLLEGLRQWGIDISAGQLNNLVTEHNDVFHREKEALLPAGLHVSSYVGVDETGARHGGQTGFCTHIGNELFAYFASSDSKSRQNFLEILRKPQTDYVVNEVAVAYWRRQQLSPTRIDVLGSGERVFADAAAWQAHLAACGLTSTRHLRIATEGALLGSLIEHGVAKDLVILSDGAPQYVVLQHAACWLHAERPLARLIPHNEQHRQAIEGVRGSIWELYQQLKAYRVKPEPARKAELTAQFEALVERRTGYPSVDGVLRELKQAQADLLRVLERPEVPLHNNTSERHIREYVTKRKISGSTRSEAGRKSRDTFASLKKTCRALGVNFWEYVKDRVNRGGSVPSLAELIRRRGEASPAGSLAAAPG